MHTGNIYAGCIPPPPPSLTHTLALAGRAPLARLARVGSVQTPRWLMAVKNVREGGWAATGFP